MAWTDSTGFMERCSALVMETRNCPFFVWSEWKVSPWTIERENNMLALGVYLMQPCPSAGRRFAASKSHLNHYWTTESFPSERTRWNALSTGFV
jgi:hypothetical protein